MEDLGMFPVVGAGFFGLVIGWVTYRTLRRKEGASKLSDIATVFSALGGAAVTKLFDDADLFAAYSIGLAIGFFGYFAIAVKVEGKASAAKFMGQ
jgi:hypothetical protein